MGNEASFCFNVTRLFLNLNKNTVVPEGLSHFHILSFLSSTVLKFQHSYQHSSFPFIPSTAFCIYHVHLLKYILLLSVVSNPITAPPLQQVSYSVSV